MDGGQNWKRNISRRRLFLQRPAEAAAFFFCAPRPGRLLRSWNLPINRFQIRRKRIMTFDMKACGERIRSLRKGKNRAREQFAEELNISTDHLRGMESGKEGASIDLLIDMAEYFGISLDYLILGKTGMADGLKNDLSAIARSIQELAEKL